MKKNKSRKKARMLKLIDQSRPRPVIRQRSAVFADKTKYKRSRKRAEERKEISGQD